VIREDEMTVSATTSTSAAAVGAPKKGGLGSLGEGDFQDPFAPVDNQQMLVQMAQFTSLSTNSEMNETLKQIASKLDALGAAQTAFLESANTSQE
jgi:flagellar basal-body rod modification protein FlgD